MTLLLKAELWARTHWINRGKVFITLSTANFFPEWSLAPRLIDPIIHLISLTFNHLQSSSACNWTTGFRGARSAPNSAGKSKPAQANMIPFEVKMNDFPELAGVSLGKAGPPLVQRVCWGPTPRSTSPLTQTSAFSWKVSPLKYQTSCCAVCGEC